MKERDIILNITVPDIITSKVESFYNPVMIFNRDISVIVAKILKPKKTGLCLAGTGIRALRLLKEAELDMDARVLVNDRKKDFPTKFLELCNLNEIKTGFEVFNDDANSFLINNKPFDYIEIDPFGSPNEFLDKSFNNIKNNGIIGITATDTAPLCGTYVNACKRKYWAIPKRDEQMHEVGLRILIRKAQLIAAQYNVAAKPVLSYFKDHYFKVFFKCEKGKKKTDDVLEQHGFYDQAGPMYLGNLGKKDFLEEVVRVNPFEENEEFLKKLLDEAELNVGLLDIHKVARDNKIKSIPKTELIIKKCEEKGIICKKSHFSVTALKGKNLNEIKEIILQLS